MAILEHSIVSVRWITGVSKFRCERTCKTATLWTLHSWFWKALSNTTVFKFSSFSTNHVHLTFVQSSSSMWMQAEQIFKSNLIWKPVLQRRPSSLRCFLERNLTGEGKAEDQCWSVSGLTCGLWSLYVCMASQSDRWCVEGDIKPSRSPPDRPDTSDLTSVIKGWCLTKYHRTDCRSRAVVISEDSGVMSPVFLETLKVYIQL